MDQYQTLSGDIVKEGDKCYFIDSDGNKRFDKIRKREDGSLYFLNYNFEIKDYPSLSRC